MGSRDPHRSLTPSGWDHLCCEGQPSGVPSSRVPAIPAEAPLAPCARAPGWGAGGPSSDRLWGTTSLWWWLSFEGPACCVYCCSQRDPHSALVPQQFLRVSWKDGSVLLLSSAAPAARGCCGCPFLGTQTSSQAHFQVLGRISQIFQGPYLQF